MKKFKVILRQVVIVEAATSAQAIKAAKENPPHEDTGTEWGHLRTTRDVTVTSCVPLRGRPPKYTGSYR